MKKKKVRTDEAKEKKEVLITRKEVFQLASASTMMILFPTKQAAEASPAPLLPPDHGE